MLVIVYKWVAASHDSEKRKLLHKECQMNRTSWKNQSKFRFGWVLQRSALALSLDLTLIRPALSSLRQIIRDSSFPTFIRSPRALWLTPFEPQDKTATGSQQHRSHSFINIIYNNVLLILLLRLQSSVPSWLLELFVTSQTKPSQCAHWRCGHFVGSIVINVYQQQPLHQLIIHSPPLY